MPNACLTTKLERIEGAIERQKSYVRTVPDPDNRALAESNLVTLVIMRDDVKDVLDQGSSPTSQHGVARLV